MNNKFFGFTLAETLITLVIVGVIAALTVPNMIIKHQKEETVTKLKKAYSVLSQTTFKAIADNGPINSWEILSSSDDGSDKFNKKYLLPYLNVMKDCGNKADEECEFVTHYIDGTNEEVLPNTYARFFLSDGTFIASRTWVNGNSYKYLTLRIDINGRKGPNRFGKDIFKYQYNLVRNDFEDGSTIEGKFMPEGFLRTPERLLEGCSRTGTGEVCATKIMKDSWQIKDDYPW